MLDWLHSPELENIKYLEKIKEKVKIYNFKYIILIGMGGSSIGPKVFKAILAPKADNFFICDTIHPDALKELEEKLDLRQSFFIIASKSGSTLEPHVVFDYFLTKIKNLGIENYAQHFMAITDPDSALHNKALEENFIVGPLGQKNIGGRYSALSAFGLMPALLMDIDIKKLITSAHAMALLSKQNNNNPALQRAQFLASNYQNNRNELIFYFSKSLKPLGAYLEQLIAESLGKNNKGIVPIIEEQKYINSNKSMSCTIALLGEEVFNNKNIPSLNITIKNIYDLGGEIFCWHMAISLCGALLNINPFDQPDVESSKKQSRAMIDLIQKQSVVNYNYDQNINNFFNNINEKSYIAILSFLENNNIINNYLEELKKYLSTKYKRPVLIQKGPSYLHSTGQLFKGGANEGAFLLLSGSYTHDMKSFMSGVSIKDLHLSQALGEAQAMRDAKRLIFHHNFKDTLLGFKELLSLIKHL
jgi:glucose-6-phosphate isomerase